MRFSNAQASRKKAGTLKVLKSAKILKFDQFTFAMISDTLGHSKNHQIILQLKIKLVLLLRINLKFTNNNRTIMNLKKLLYFKHLRINFLNRTSFLCKCQSVSLIEMEV